MGNPSQTYGASLAIWDHTVFNQSINQSYIFRVKSTARSTGRMLMNVQETVRKWFSEQVSFEPLTICGIHFRHVVGPTVWNSFLLLPATRRKWTRPALTPATQAGTRFIYPGGMEGWVYLGSLIAARPGVEPMTAWSQVRRPNRYATKPPVNISQETLASNPQTATKRYGP